MNRPLTQLDLPGVRRAGRMVKRISLGLLAFGTAVMSFGLAIGIGVRLDGDAEKVTTHGETIALRSETVSGDAPDRDAVVAPASGSSTPSVIEAAEARAARTLQRFHSALRDLEAGQRRQPVSILHLGDGHAFGDRLDTHLRTLLQSRFGDAGRGLLIPAGVVKNYRSRGLRFDTTAGWTGATALEPSPAVLGISGAQISAVSAQAEMSVTLSDGKFDAVEVAFLTGPDRGAANVLIDARPHSIVTRAPDIGVQRAKIPSSGSTLAVKPAGTGPITVLSWSLLKNHPGVRYSAIGLPGGGLDAIERLDELVLIDDLRALKPDLIMLSFGGVEGMDDGLDPARYRERFAGLLRLLGNLAPEASIAVIGPPDINRVPDFAHRLRTSAATGCRALSVPERQEHDAMLAAADERLARWYPPPRLDDVRHALTQAATAHGAFYWDWSEVMGGSCGMHAWVHAKPELALPDHATLTDEGYQRSARALFGQLLQGYAAAAPAPVAQPAAAPSTFAPRAKQASQR